MPGFLWALGLQTQVLMLACQVPERNTLAGISIGSRFQKFQQLGRLAPLLLVSGEAGHLGSKSVEQRQKAKQKADTKHPS